MTQHISPTQTSIPTVTLNNGAQIPQLGFGVFQIKPADTRQAVLDALAAGYRHIDTAQMYGNEKQVGEAIRDAGIDPAEIWVTSKINNNRHGYDSTLSAFDQSLTDLGTDRIDLMLIHWPLPTVGDFVGTWRALERVYAEGQARSIGVSNFQQHHLQRLFDETAVVPVVNQIELHPYLTQEPLHAFGIVHGVATEAWSPIGRGRVLDDPVLAKLAAAHGKSIAQLALRWHIQLGTIIFPKSSSPLRMAENLDLFDFELSPADMDAISALNRDERVGPDPDVFDWVPRG